MKETKINALPPRRQSDGGSRTTVYLTNNRTFQQKRDPENEKKKREKLKNEIVKIKKSKPFFCQSQQILLIHLKNNQVDEIVKSSLRCKSWSCPVCAPINAVQAYFKIRETAILNDMQYFLTLTLNPKTIPEEYFAENLNRTHKYITYLFNRFANKIRYLYKNSKERFKYIWIVEFQKKGNAHLHILLNVRLDIDFVRKEWVKIGGGTMMKVEKIKSIERVSSYVSTYITKGLKAISDGNIGFFHWERRYTISHSCIKPKRHITKLSDNPTLYKQLKTSINKVIIGSSDTINLK